MLTSSSTTPLAQTPKFITPQARHGRAPEARLSSCGTGGSTAASYEVGPAVLRPDGTVFATGANTCGPGHTAIYNSHTGTWAAGPDFPAAYGSADGPAALEPNGNVLIFSSPSRFYPPAGQFFEWNGNSLSLTNTPASAFEVASFVGRLLG